MVCQIPCPGVLSNISPECHKFLITRGKTEGSRLFSLCLQHILKDFFHSAPSPNPPPNFLQGQISYFRYCFLQVFAYHFVPPFYVGSPVWI